MENKKFQSRFSLITTEKRGFGLIEILLVIILIMFVYAMRANFFSKSNNPEGYVQKRIATKTRVEKQVRQIQSMAKKRYG